MHIVYTFLSLSLLWANTYSTYKTLAQPVVGPRGQPTSRLVGARNRDMKTCLAVWIVWVTWTVVERLGDSTVGIVMPFYHEIKCLLLIIILLSRSWAAEPLVINVIRPVLKPYIPLIDFSLHWAHLIGDFLWLVATLPYNSLYAWWYGTPFTPKSPLKAFANANSESEDGRSRTRIPRPVSQYPPGAFRDITLSRPLEPISPPPPYIQEEAFPLINVELEKAEQKSAAPQPDDTAAVDTDSQPPKVPLAANRPVATRTRTRTTTNDAPKPPPKPKPTVTKQTQASRNAPATRASVANGLRSLPGQSSASSGHLPLKQSIEGIRTKAASASDGQLPLNLPIKEPKPPDPRPLPNEEFRAPLFITQPPPRPPPPPSILQPLPQQDFTVFPVPSLPQPSTQLAPPPPPPPSYYPPSPNPLPGHYPASPPPPPPQLIQPWQAANSGAGTKYEIWTPEPPIYPTLPMPIPKPSPKLSPEPSNQLSITPPPETQRSSTGSNYSLIPGSKLPSPPVLPAPELRSALNKVANFNPPDLRQKFRAAHPPVTNIGVTRPHVRRGSTGSEAYYSGREDGSRARPDRGQPVTGHGRRESENQGFRVALERKEGTEDSMEDLSPETAPNPRGTSATKGRKPRAKETATDKVLDKTVPPGDDKRKRKREVEAEQPEIVRRKIAADDVESRLTANTISSKQKTKHRRVIDDVDSLKMNPISITQIKPKGRAAEVKKSAPLKPMPISGTKRKHEESFGKGSPVKSSKNTLPQSEDEATEDDELNIKGSAKKRRKVRHLEPNTLETLNTSHPENGGLTDKENLTPRRSRRVASAN